MAWLTGRRYSGRRAPPNHAERPRIKGGDHASPGKDAAGGLVPRQRQRLPGGNREIYGGPAPLAAGARVDGGIVPHAGWYFSGKAAARVFGLSAKATQPQVVCVFGGHLGGDSPPLLVSDEAWETPWGTSPWPPNSMRHWQNA